MSSKEVNTYVHKRTKEGQDVLCPVDDTEDKMPNAENELEDCVEQDVVGRYAGNIKVRSPSERPENKK